MEEKEFDYINVIPFIDIMLVLLKIALRSGPSAPGTRADSTSLFVGATHRMHCDWNKGVPNPNAQLIGHVAIERGTISCPGQAGRARIA